MLWKKSYWADERNFLAPLVRPTRGDVRDHIDSHKSDRRSSCLSYKGLQRRKQRKTDLREIFGAAEFSTFSTVSARSRHRTVIQLPRRPVQATGRKLLVRFPLQLCDDDELVFGRLIKRN